GAVISGGVLWAEGGAGFAGCAFPAIGCSNQHRRVAKPGLPSFAFLPTADSVKGTARIAALERPAGSPKTGLTRWPNNRFKRGRRPKSPCAIPQHINPTRQRGSR